MPIFFSRERCFQDAPAYSDLWKSKVSKSKKLTSSIHKNSAKALQCFLVQRKTIKALWPIGKPVDLCENCKRFSAYKEPVKALWSTDDI